MRISHNLMAMNANRMLGINDKKKIGSAEKLASGYRINRAADDAAGLAISEKMRRLIRGLKQGTTNAQDGVSWVQIGDGALNEVHDILHRMTEVTVKSLNGTNTDEDMMALELEFEQLQSELDRISDTTTFNEIPIFDKHEIPYYQCEGSAKWDPQQMHAVTAGQNDLTFQYYVAEGAPLQTKTVTIPPGEYTTQELVDEIETLLTEANTGQDKIFFEYTPEGYCNVNLESGEKLDKVTGGLSYLMYDMYKGGGYGALIGTTSFPSETSRLNVESGQNDNMSFTIEDFAGGSQEKSITIPAGSYTRSELIDLLNTQLADTTVRATAYGDGIRLASEDAIVTGFKGNMFKIDGSGTVYNSVFYDNVKYGGVDQKPAVFSGGYVLPTDSRDEEHKYYEIDSTNNTLILQPNKMDNTVTITIPDGKYTAEQMATQLNTLFTAEGIDLAVSSKVSSGFAGLTITSNIEGLDSQINMDSTSSAYNTLFTTREYNQYGSQISPVNQTRADSEGVFRGSKDLAILTAEPLTIVSGQNDSFKLTLNGAEYAITMSAGTYSDVSSVVTELNNQLNGSAALVGYKGKITATQVDNKIVLTGNIGQSINTIRVSEADGQDVFDAIFQGYRLSTSYPTASGNGSVTLNTPYDGNIDSSESNMTIKVDGTNYNVNLPTGDVSQDDIKNAIETAIPPRIEITNNEFITVADNGNSNSRNFSATATGRTNPTSWSGNATGDSKQVEGRVEFEWSDPAVLQLGPELQSSMTVDSSNNSIRLNLNNVTQTIMLDNGTYTPTSLKNALQTKIDAAFGTGMGGAVVSISNNKLVLTSRLPDGYDGKDTYISCSTANSSFLAELNTTRTPAVWTSNNNLASAITIDSSNRAFTFRYGENGSTQNISLTLTQGNYTQATIVAEINNQLAKTTTGITASLSSGKLVLTSDAVGSDVYIFYGTELGGSSAEALFGPLTQPSPADIVVNLKTEEEIAIEAGTSDTFTIKVNGVDRTVILDEGNYNRVDFVTMLNGKLTAANAGVQAYVSGNMLGYKTTATGTSASVSMSYGGGGNSMKAIYGVTENRYSGVTVSFDADGKLSLGTTIPGTTISVYSGNGGAFQQPEVTSNPVATTGTDGYHSTAKSYIDGVNLSGDITVDQWNNNLNFTFTDNGTNQNVTIDIPEGSYSYADLETKLQELINAQVGADKIEVTVSSGGVRLEAVNVGSLYQFSNFSGDFYDKVICSCTERSYEQNATDTAGTQTVDTAYTVGRKDVRTGTVEIRRGISDEFSLDLTYGNTVHSINITLDAGEYSGDELKAHLQGKINEQLTAMGLQENLIEVGIGGINTGVYGSNDQNALNFSLSKAVQAPAEGPFIIDGVSGSAAFEIFYQTDGKMEPAYIMGSKDVSNGVTVPTGETDLSLEVDGVTYPITIPEGDYTAEEILDVMNEQFDAVGAPVVAELDENRLKISHRMLGEHEIQNVHGEARDNIFFEEHGKTEAEDPRYVQLSSEVTDHIVLNRHILSTAFLGLNSCCISKHKNAEKALVRIEKALEMVSDIRSDFGSTQNRLEHAINNNENKEENLQSAESVIRDTDMAKEMVQFSNASILRQAGQAMLAQANQSQQGIMTLLT